MYGDYVQYREWPIGTVHACVTEAIRAARAWLANAASQQRYVLTDRGVMRRCWLAARLVVVLGVGAALPAVWTSLGPAEIAYMYGGRTISATDDWAPPLVRAAGLNLAEPPLSSARQLDYGSSLPAECSNAYATTALRLARLPAFPVRCRSDLEHLYKQLVFSPGSPLLERSGAVGLVQAEVKQTPQAEQTHVPHLVRRVFADDTSWLPTGTRKLPLSCNVPDATLHWLHFGSSLHNESVLYLALEACYAAVAPGGLLSGSNFLDYGSKRHPLINTCGKSAHYPKGTPLFKHKRKNEYVHRLDTVIAHAARSAVKRFARKHELLIHVTYYYDCNDDPTWYIVKPSATNGAFVDHGRRSAQLGFCKDYEMHTSDMPLSRAVTASHKSCSFNSRFIVATSRLIHTDSFPVRCRDDLLQLATELGLNGTAVEVGNGTGVKFDLLDAEIADVWKNSARLHKSVEDPVHDWVNRAEKKKSTQKGASLDKRLRPLLPDRLAGVHKAASHLDWFLALARAGTAARVSSASSVADDSLDWVHITDHLPTKRATARDLKAWWPKLRSGGIISGDDFIDRCDARRPLDSNSVTFTGAFEDRTVYQERPATGSYGVRRAVKDWAGSQALVPLFVTYMYDCYSEPVWYAVKP